MVSAQLKRAGHAVVTAIHGGDGLAAFETQRFDLVITDILMPEKEGLETIRELRARDAAVPIIAMTEAPPNPPQHGAASIDYLQFARTLGAAGTIHKPFTEEQLNAAIAACLPAKP